MIVVLLSGLCKSNGVFDFGKTVQFCLVCFLSTSLSSSLCSLSCLPPLSPSQAGSYDSRVFGRLLLFFFTIQVIPSISNMWNIRGYWAVLAVLHHPIVSHHCPFPSCAGLSAPSQYRASLLLLRLLRHLHACPYYSRYGGECPH